MTDATAAPEAAAEGQGEILADAVVQMVNADGATAALNQDVVEVLAAQVRQRWIESGISVEQIAALDSVSYDIADVGGAHLGVASGFSITIDDDAGGNGVGSWFIDTTPDRDEEFGAMGSGAASGRYDLLSTLIHEQGHVLGLSDVFADRSDVMDGFLGAGTRRLPMVGQADGAVVGSLVGDNYLTAHTTSVELDGIDLIIEDIDGADTNDRLFIGIVDGRLEVSDTHNTVGTTIVGATELGTKGRGVSIDLASFTGDIVVRTLGGDDVVTFGDLSGLSGGVVVEDGDGHDVVRQTGEITLIGGADLEYRAEEIRLGRGSAITVADGAIDLLGNIAETSVKRSVGVYANASQLTTTGTGDVTITGFGGVVGGGNRGVDLRNLDIALGGGTLWINGTGGNGGSNNDGVRIGRGSEVTLAGSGNLFVIGNGGGTGSGNRGVTIQREVTLETAAGGLNVFGTGAVGARSANIGVYLQKATLKTNGALTMQVSGTAKGTGSENSGVILRGTTLHALGNGQVSLFGISSSVANGSGNRGIDMRSATIEASGGGNISVSATGGSGKNSNEGIRSSRASLSSVSGSVNISGIGSHLASKNGNRGIHFSSGTISAGTTLTMTANGGGGVNSNEALRLASANLGAVGMLTINGSASTGTTGSANRGIWANKVDLTGSGVDVTGRAGGGRNNNEAVRFQNGSMTATTAAVEIRAEGSAVTTGAGNRGAYLNRITLHADTDIVVTAFGGAGTNSNFSLFLNGSTLMANNGHANVSATNFGDTTGRQNYGAMIRSTSISAANSSTITARGGEGTNSNYGLTIIRGTFDVAAGDLILDGIADSDTSGRGNYGVNINRANFTAGAFTSIIGTGGGGTSGNYGAQITFANLISLGADASIQGNTAGATAGSGNFGLRAISTNVSGMNVTIDGVGNGGTSNNYGLQYRNGSVTATAGNTVIAGTVGGATSGSRNSGATLSNVVVQSQSGISVSGTAGAGTSRNHGLQVDGGSLINNLGAVTIVGDGNGGTTGAHNFGSRISRATIVTSEDLILVGTAGVGTSGNFGIYLNRVMATGGDQASISGIAGVANSGSNNYGVHLNRSSVSAINQVGIDGTGGSGKSNNWGTRIIGGTINSDITSVHGMANAGTTRSANSGVYIFSGVTLIGTTGLEITGTGGGGTGLNFGVFMNRGVTAAGAMVTGTATDGVSANEAGDFFP